MRAELVRDGRDLLLNLLLEPADTQKNTCDGF